MPRFRVRMHAPDVPLMVDGRRGRYGAYITRVVDAPDASSAEVNARREATQSLATRVAEGVAVEELSLVTEAVDRLPLLAGCFARQSGITFYRTDADVAAS